LKPKANLIAILALSLPMMAMDCPGDETKDDSGAGYVDYSVEVADATPRGPESAIPEPTAGLVFATGLLLMSRAIRTRKSKE
jgi:hypothetical protein